MTIEERLDKLESEFKVLNDYMHSIENMLLTNNEMTQEMQMFIMNKVDIEAKSLDVNERNNSST